MNFRILMEALLSLHGGSLDYAIAYTADSRVAETTVVQDKKQGKQNGSDPCGWIGVTGQSDDNSIRRSHRHGRALRRHF
jgi:hypothetical protein